MRSILIHFVTVEPTLRNNKPIRQIAHLRGVSALQTTTVKLSPEVVVSNLHRHWL